MDKENKGNVIFNNDHMLTIVKLISGEEVEQEKLDSYKEYTTHYENVRQKYFEKSNKKGLVDFHFSPGTDFMKTSVDEIVESLLEMDEKIESGALKCEPLDFGDSYLVNNPPKTGKEKIDLAQYITKEK